MESRFTAPDEAHSRLRAIMATLERQIASVGEGPNPDEARRALFVTFRTLVAELGIGPEPQTRKCPNCGNIGMQAATRCGYCWATLSAAG